MINLKNKARFIFSIGVLFLGIIFSYWYLNISIYSSILTNPISIFRLQYWGLGGILVGAIIGSSIIGIIYFYEKIENFKTN